MKHIPFLIGSDKFPGFSKLIEEMGEALQVIGKLMGKFSMGIHWDGKPIKESLEEEIADVMAATAFVIAHNNLDVDAIEKRAAKKLRKFDRWHRNVQAGRESTDGGDNNEHR